MNIGLWTALFLALVTIVKVIVSQRVGNRTLSRPVRLALYAPIIYWLCLASSMLLGGDTAVALRVLELKAVLLIFPLCLLIGDTGYLNRHLVRGLFYALWVSCLGVFFYFVYVGICRLADGASLAAVTNSSFDTRHHAYVALYAVSALAFVYYELRHHWRELPRALRVALLVSVLLLILYVILVNSRAGMLVMWGVLGLCCLHSLPLSWWHTLLVTAALSGYIVAVGALLPGYTDRVTQTVENVQEEKGDARINITQSTGNAVLKHPILGYGIGSYHANLVNQYGEDDFDSGVQAKYNAHNQYMESMLSFGIVGLLALLFFVSSPLWLTWITVKLRFAGLLAAAIVMVNLLVESMLERQMGLLFIGWFYAVIALAVSVEQNKFVQSEKS